MLRPRINPFEPRAPAARVPRPSSAWAGIYSGGNEWTSARPARPHTPNVCHLERSEASAERSRKTPLLFGSHEKQNTSPPRTAEARVAVNGCPVQAPLGRGFTRAEKNGLPPPC